MLNKGMGLMGIKEHAAALDVENILRGTAKGNVPAGSTQ